MTNRDGICVGINAFQYLLTTVQLESVLRIVSLILSILSTLIIIGFKIADWYKKAKEDGKITKEEVKQLVDENKEELKKFVKDIKQVSQEIKEKESK